MRTDVRLLFTTRGLRLFGYGFVSVILALYLTELGFSTTRVGALLTLTLVGDTVISLFLTTRADRFGRRRMLIIGSLLMVFAGVIFAVTRDYYLLLFAATIGVISPSGNEVGPFLSIEQAALSELVPAERRVGVFAWYNLAGSFTTALGALAGGFLAQSLLKAGFSHVWSYRIIVLSYAGIGVFLALVFLFLSPKVEVPAVVPRRKSTGPLRSFLGLHASRRFVLKLSALFSLDAFAGGFVVQSVVAYWFSKRFGVGPATLGSIFFAANILAGMSALLASRIARVIGLLNTMVFTHIPSNILLILVPMMPTLDSAIAVLLLRFSISQMDVPTRQAFTVAAVNPDERAAAAGVTSVARTTGAAIAPSLAGVCLATPGLANLIFFLAGGIKIVYDLLLYFSFAPVSRSSGEKRR